MPQSNEYFHNYYQRNKQRIKEREQKRYQTIRADPIKSAEFTKRCTIHSRNYRARHPERVATTRTICRTNRRIKALTIVGGAICKQCGCTEISFLEINHKNGGGCKEYRKIGNKLMDDILTGRRGTDDLDVRCRVCNALHYLEHKNPTEAKRFKINWV